METLAGSGIAGFADGVSNLAQFNYPQGITVDKKGNVYVCDYGNHRIRKIIPTGKQLVLFVNLNKSNYSPTGNVSTVAGSTEGYRDGVGSEAQFSNIYGIAIDEGENLLVCDSGNDRIRKVTLQGEYRELLGTTKKSDDRSGENNCRE